MAEKCKYCDKPVEWGLNGCPTVSRSTDSETDGKLGMRVIANVATVSYWAHYKCYEEYE